MAAKRDFGMVVIGDPGIASVGAAYAEAIGERVLVVERTVPLGPVRCGERRARQRRARLIAYGQHVTRQQGVVPPQEVRQVLQRIAAVPTDDGCAIDRLERLGGRFERADVHLADRGHVRVGASLVAAPRLVVQTPTMPAAPVIPGLDLVPAVDDDSVWRLGELPERVAVIGPGGTAIEIAQCLSRLGAQVTLVMPREAWAFPIDHELRHALLTCLATEGIEVLAGIAVRDVAPSTGPVVLHCSRGSRSHDVAVDGIVTAWARRPQPCVGADGRVLAPVAPIEAADQLYGTEWRGVHLLGDFDDPANFAYEGIRNRWDHLARTRLGSGVHGGTLALPHIVLTDPELAMLGASVAELEADGRWYESTLFAEAEAPAGRSPWRCHLLTRQDRRRFLGAALLAEEAGNHLLRWPVFETDATAGADLASIPTLPPRICWSVVRNRPEGWAGLWRWVRDHLFGRRGSPAGGRLTASKRVDAGSGPAGAEGDQPSPAGDRLVRTDS